MLQRSLVLTAKKELKWKETKLPKIEKDEILVRTIAGAISSGTELPQYMGTDITNEYPKETGYESFGEVVNIGEEVENFKIGEQVVAFYGHKNYAVLKDHEAIIVPKNIHYSQALLTILSCDAAKGVLKLNPTKEDKVLVTGMGTMGLLTVHFLKEYINVQRIDVVEPHPLRANLAKKLGATEAYTDPENCPLHFYDYGLECSAANEAFQLLQKATSHSAKICVLSDGNKQSFELSADFHEKELQVIGSSDGWDYEAHAQWFFAKKRSSLREVFQHVTSDQELIQCFQDLSEENIDPVKVLVKYE